MRESIIRIFWCLKNQKGKFSMSKSKYKQPSIVASSIEDRDGCIHYKPRGHHDFNMEFVEQYDETKDFIVDGKLNCFLPANYNSRADHHMGKICGKSVFVSPRNSMILIFPRCTVDRQKEIYGLVANCLAEYQFCMSGNYGQDFYALTYSCKMDTLEVMKSLVWAMENLKEQGLL
jgi:hypothetical protein